jgi:hypothetical protein
MKLPSLFSFLATRLGALALVAALSSLSAGCAWSEKILSGPEQTKQESIALKLSEAETPILSQRVSGWQGWPPIRADKPEDVIAGRHNWRDFQDASLLAGVDVYGDLLSVVAVVNDDDPLVQTRDQLVYDQWREGPVYAGDALQLKLTPLDRAWKPFLATIQLGSDGMNPRFIVEETPKGEVGPVDDAVIVVERAPGGYEVYVRLAQATDFGLWPFHNTPYAIEMTLHDVDGAVATHCALKGKTESRP